MRLLEGSIDLPNKEIISSRYEPISPKSGLDCWYINAMDRVVLSIILSQKRQLRAHKLYTGFYDDFASISLSDQRGSFALRQSLH